MHKSRRAGGFTAKEGEIKDHSKPEQEEASEEAGSQRLDKWLWFARFAKTRSLAQRLVLDGQVRVNRERRTKPSFSVKPGDMVSVEIAEALRLVEVLSRGDRRGPASEAATLYRDLAPKLVAARDAMEPPIVREQGTGRPTKLERRRLDRLRDC